VRIERSIEIDRPPADVFAVVADMRRDPEWCKRVLSCEQVEGEGPGAGARYRSVHRPQRLRKPMELDVRVEAFEPPDSMRLREQDTDGVFRVTYSLEPHAGGTRITQCSEVDLSLPRVLHPVGRFEIGRHLKEQLAALKRLLEASPARP
jgi:uncharacterized protein YndB with AHSA1/START domain